MFCLSGQLIPSIEVTGKIPPGTLTVLAVTDRERSEQLISLSCSPVTRSTVTPLSMKLYFCWDELRYQGPFNVTPLVFYKSGQSIRSIGVTGKIPDRDLTVLAMTDRESSEQPISLCCSPLPRSTVTPLSRRLSFCRH